MPIKIKNIKILIFIRVNGAERKVFSSSLAFREHIEECGLANIGDPDYAHFQICAHLSNQWFLFRLFYLFWWHPEIVEKKMLSYNKSL